MKLLSKKKRPRPLGLIEPLSMSSPVTPRFSAELWVGPRASSAYWPAFKLAPAEQTTGATSVRPVTSQPPRPCQRPNSNSTLAEF